MNKLEKKIELATEDLDLFIKMYEEDYTIDGEVNKFMYIEDEDDMENYMLDIEKDKEDENYMLSYYMLSSNNGFDYQ